MKKSIKKFKIFCVFLALFLLLFNLCLYFTPEVNADDKEKTTTTDDADSDSEDEEDMKFLFIGDSRTVNLWMVYTNASYWATDEVFYTDGNINFLAKGAMGLNWLKDAFERREVADFEDYNIIFNLGVNDLNNANNYIDYYNSLPEEFYQNNNVYFMSVNPLDAVKAAGVTTATNEQIFEFNKIYEDGIPENSYYIDCCEEFFDNDGAGKTQDGIHYTNEVSREIIDWVIDYIRNNGGVKKKSVPWNLMLINDEYPIKESYCESIETIAINKKTAEEIEESLKVKVGNISIDKRIAEDLLDMVVAMRMACDEEKATLDINAGYRTFEEQDDAYKEVLNNLDEYINRLKSDSDDDSTVKEDKTESTTIIMETTSEEDEADSEEDEDSSKENKAKLYEAVAGASEHNAGFCIDFSVGGKDDFSQTDMFEWLCSNAYRFGFILRYPSTDEAKETTGREFDPSHWRYIGEDDAIEFMKFIDADYTESEKSGKIKDVTAYVNLEYNGKTYEDYYWEIVAPKYGLIDEEEGADSDEELSEENNKYSDATLRRVYYMVRHPVKSIGNLLAGLAQLVHNAIAVGKTGNLFNITWIVDWDSIKELFVPYVLVSSVVMVCALILRYLRYMVRGKDTLITIIRDTLLYIGAGIAPLAVLILAGNLFNTMTNLLISDTTGKIVVLESAYQKEKEKEDEEVEITAIQLLTDEKLSRDLFRETFIENGKKQSYKYATVKMPVGYNSIKEEIIYKEVTLQQLYDTVSWKNYIDSMEENRSSSSYQTDGQLFMDLDLDEDGEIDDDGDEGTDDSEEDSDDEDKDSKDKAEDSDDDSSITDSDRSDKDGDSDSTDVDSTDRDSKDSSDADNDGDEDSDDVEGEEDEDETQTEPVIDNWYTEMIPMVTTAVTEESDGKIRGTDITVYDDTTGLTIADVNKAVMSETSPKYLYYSCNEFVPVHYDNYDDSVFYYFYDWVKYQYLAYWAHGVKKENLISTLAKQYVLPGEQIENSILGSKEEGYYVDDSFSSYKERIEKLEDDYLSKVSSGVYRMYLDDSYVRNDGEFYNDLFGLSYLFKMTSDDTIADGNYAMVDDLYRNASSIEVWSRAVQINYLNTMPDYDAFCDMIKEGDYSYINVQPLTGVMNGYAWYGYRNNTHLKANNMKTGMYKYQFTPSSLAEKFKQNLDTPIAEGSKGRVPWRIYASQGQLINDYGKEEDVEWTTLERRLCSLSERIYKQVRKVCNYYPGQISDDVMIFVVALEATSEFNKMFSSNSIHVYPDGITKDRLDMDKMIKLTYADSLVNTSSLDTMYMIYDSTGGIAVVIIVLLSEILMFVSSAVRFILLCMFFIGLCFLSLNYYLNRMPAVMNLLYGLSMQLITLVLSHLLTVCINVGMFKMVAGVDSAGIKILLSFVGLFLYLVVCVINISMLMVFVKDIKNFGGLLFRHKVQIAKTEVELSISDNKNIDVELNDTKMNLTKEQERRIDNADKLDNKRKKKSATLDEDTLKEAVKKNAKKKRKNKATVDTASMNDKDKDKEVDEEKEEKEKKSERRKRNSKVVDKKSEKYKKKIKLNDKKSDKK